MRLFTSERFQKEYKLFSSKLEEITNLETKKKLDDLLNQLVREVKAIDARHEDFILTRKIPSSVEDSRTNLLEVRKRIDRLIRDWDESRKHQA